MVASTAPHLDLNRLYLDCRRELELFVHRARLRSMTSLRRDQIQDAVHEAFKVVLEHATSPATPPWRDARAYLFGVCLRVAAGLQREEGRKALRSNAALRALGEPANPLMADESDPSLEGLGAIVEPWIDLQSEQDRAFLHHRYAQGESLRSCAALLGGTVWSVRSMECRILGELLKAMPESDGGRNDLEWAKRALKRKIRTKRTARKRS